MNSETLPLWWLLEWSTWYNLESPGASFNKGLSRSTVCDIVLFVMLFTSCLWNLCFTKVHDSFKKWCSTRAYLYIYELYWVHWCLWIDTGSRWHMLALFIGKATHPWLPWLLCFVRNKLCTWTLISVSPILSSWSRSHYLHEYKYILTVCVYVCVCVHACLTMNRNNIVRN